MAQRISEKKKEGTKVKDEQLASDVGELKPIENEEKSEQTEAPKVDQILSQADGVSKKRKKVKNVGENEVHDISDDEHRAENVVDVFQEFTGSSLEIKSLWDSRFEFENLIDVECSLPGDQSRLDK
ncbi:interferon-induced, double-stranded RNA-activated protein kinase [Sesbania bispinosa]|nr:interferon-induced, double-stranded RNA-activated protein kinase [Sesbania bispinosa]